jgi:hypothetical protein
MHEPPLALPQLLQFLHQVTTSCRTYADRQDVPAFARERLREAGEQVDFFLQRAAYRRSFNEARRATAIHGAVARYLQANVDAVTALQIDLAGMR